jgi:hypothetical protein
MRREDDLTGLSPGHVDEVFDHPPGCDRVQPVLDLLDQDPAIAGAGNVQIGTTGCRYREWHETGSLSRSFTDRLAASRLEPLDARCSGW